MNTILAKKKKKDTHTDTCICIRMQSRGRLCVTSEYLTHRRCGEGTDTQGEVVHTHVLSLLSINSSTFLKLPSTGKVSDSFLLCLSLLFFPQLFVKLPQTTTLPSSISFSLELFGSLPPIQCYEPPSIVLQALYQI